MQYRRPACAMHADRSQVRGATFFFTAKVNKGFGNGVFREHQIMNELDFTNHVAPVGATCL